MSGKSNIMMTLVAQSHREGKPIVMFDIESGGMFFDVKTHRYWTAPKVRYLTKLRRDNDTRRWWKHWLG